MARAWCPVANLLAPLRARGVARGVEARVPPLWARRPQLAFGGAAGAAAVAGTLVRSAATQPGARADGSGGGGEDGEFLRRLRSMDSCALCDASDKRARVVTTVTPLKAGYRMAGRALTVAIDGDFLEVLAAIRGAGPGDVLMIDAGMRGEPADDSWPRAGGMFGELLASEAARRGVAGMVIDGNCRDTPILLQMSLPIFCRGRHPNAGTAKRRGAVNVEISMGGVTVRPGDYVLGDDDGVVVCSGEELREWLPKAEAIQEVESAMLSHVQSGGSLFDKLPNFDEHLATVARGQDSKLQFV
mmetsp:Transcript_148834/g.478087  ORF Transcript_148834/g.478087 Transcript_148834/m.478087 type:complete len:301 (+) Transcript_148834:68-970(+)